MLAAVGSVLNRERVDEELLATLPRAPTGNRTVPISIVHGTRVFTNDADRTRIQKADTLLKVVFPTAFGLTMLSVALRTRKKGEPLSLPPQSDKIV